MSEVAWAQTTQDKKTEALRLLNQGIQLYQTSRYREAISALESALGRYREIKDQNGEAISLLGLGEQYRSLGQYQKAIDFYQQSLVITRQIGDRSTEATSLNNLGEVYRSLGQYQKAIDFYQQSLVITKQIGDRKLESVSLNNLGIAYNYLGQYQKAIDFYQQSVTFFKQVMDRNGEARSLSNLGNAYRSLGQYQKAIDYFQESLAIQKQIGDRGAEAVSLNSLGLAYRSLGQYQKAIGLYQQSLAIKEQSGDLNGKATSLNNLGEVYRSLGQYQKAIDYFLKSLVIKKQIGDRDGEVASLNSLGAAYSSLGQYQKAIEYFQQSSAIVNQVGNRNSMARLLNNLGVQYNKLGQYQKAIDYYQQSLVIQKQIGDRSGEAVSLNNLGFTHNSLGEHQKAIDYYQQSLAIQKQIGDRAEEATSLNNLGLAYDYLRQYQKAIDYYQQSLAIQKQIGARAEEATSLNNLATVFNKLNQSQISIPFLKQAINIYESIRRDIKGLNKEEQRSYITKVSISYRALASLLLQQNRIMEALQVLDLLKVQELEDYLKNIKGSDRSAQGVRLLAPEKAISDKLLTVSFENAPALNQQLANQLQQLPKSEINKVPDYLNQIPRGTVLLYPFILGDRLEIILFSPNNLPIRRTVKISQKQIEALVIGFKVDLLNTRSQDYKESGQEIYNLLIKPIENDLQQFNAKTILYAPDGQLRYIPLAALYDGKQFLIEKYQVSNLIAYTLTDFSHRTQNIKPNILAGAFGGKAGEKKFGEDSLPASITEVDKIANYFQGNATSLKENQFSRQATESRFKNHNILHFATHAAFNSGTPDQSFIIFGNGDKIFLNEIADWQIPNVDLIVLSACQTGVGKLGDGVEILGFGYQVQKAGAKQAIASLWKVEDDKTTVLMSAFYAELQKGNVSVTEALSRAQMSLIKSKEYNHPFYWSAFFAIGNGL